MRPTRAPSAAPAHIAHGSKVTTNVQRSSRQESPNALVACRSARTSACASGSASCSRRFVAVARTVPSASTTTAPTGTSPGGVERATSMAFRISSSSATWPPCRGRPPPMSRSGWAGLPGSVVIVLVVRQVGVQQIGELLVEAQLLGHADQLLRRVVLRVVEDNCEQLLADTEVLQHVEFALWPGGIVLVGLGGFVLGRSVDVQLVEHVGRQVIIDRGGGVRHQNPHPTRDGAHDRAPGVLDADQPQNGTFGAFAAEVVDEALEGIGRII